MALTQKRFDKLMHKFANGLGKTNEKESKMGRLFDEREVTLVCPATITDMASKAIVWKGTVRVIVNRQEQLTYLPRTPKGYRRDLECFTHKLTWHWPEPDPLTGDPYESMGLQATTPAKPITQ